MNTFYQKIIRLLIISFIAGIVTLSPNRILAQDIPLIVTGPINQINNRANDISFIFTSNGQSPAANLSWGSNPPDSWKLNLDLSKSINLRPEYGVQLFSGVSTNVYTPGPFVRLNNSIAVIIPGGFTYTVQKGGLYQLGLYVFSVYDGAATQDVTFRYKQSDSNGGAGGGSGGGGSGGGGSGGGGANLLPAEIAPAIGALGLLPIPAIVSGLLPRNVDANPGTAQRYLDDLMQTVLHRDTSSVDSSANHKSTSDVWVRGFGGSIQQTGGKIYQNNWQGSEGGVVVGGNLNIGQYGAVGIFGSYGWMGVQQNGNGGGGWMPSVAGGGLYSRWDTPTFFAGMVVSGNSFTGQQTRGITYPGLSLTASGNRSASSLTTAFEAGYKIHAPYGLSVVPSFLADWSVIQENSFSEQGATINYGGSAFNFSNLDYGNRVTQWLNNDLGVTISRPVPLGKNLFTPSIRMGWNADWQLGRSTQPIYYSFSHTTIQVPGSWQDMQQMGLSTELNYSIGKRVSLYVRGQALVIGEASYYASAGINYHF